MQATRVGAFTAALGSEEYVCSRCGRRAACKSSRKPEHCQDCDSVLRYRPPVVTAPPEFPVFTREEQLQGHRDYRRGLRDELTMERNRSYERAVKRAK